jgi:peptidoglycan/LPS O-acetylase OafA/YrhL
MASLEGDNAVSTGTQIPSDRLHALDAVRGFALLLGVVLHSCAAFLQDFPMPPWKLEPHVAPAVLYYSIHIFRMSAFFLMAGFFARMVVERRGVQAFARDRAKRILLPLVAGLPVVAVVTAVCIVLGALPHGTDYLKSVIGAPPGAPQGPPPAASFNFSYLWFLYYLLIFYVLTLAIRTVVHRLDSRGSFVAACDRVVTFLMRGPWGPVLLALPAALYYYQYQSWTEWLGLPAPVSPVPDLGALIGYAVPFGLGWLLNRQVPTLMALRNSWLIYLVLAMVLTVVCLGIIGTTPLWQGPNLHGAERALYTATYMIGVWCWVFAVVGAAVRFLSRPSPTTRYLADSSYWIYLMHMGPIVFFITLLRPYHLPWAIMLVIMVGGSMLVLLPSYHYLVRFTWVGAILNGRRRAHAIQVPPASAPAT